MKKTPLPISSASGESPTFSLAAGDLKKLEVILGKEVPKAAVSCLAEVTAMFIDDRRFELAQQSWRDVADLLRPWEEIAAALFKGSYKPKHSDASFQLKELLGQQLDKRMVVVTDDLFVDQAKLNEAYSLPGQISLRISRAVLQRIAMELSTAVSATKDEISKQANERVVKHLDADAVLLLRLTDWASLFGYRYGEYQTTQDGSDKGYPPSRFSHFVSALLKMVEQPYRGALSSEPSAVAARLGVAKRQAKRAKKELALGERE